MITSPGLHCRQSALRSPGAAGTCLCSSAWYAVTCANGVISHTSEIFRQLKLSQVPRHNTSSANPARADLRCLLERLHFCSKLHCAEVRIPQLRYLLLQTSSAMVRYVSLLALVATALLLVAPAQGAWVTQPFCEVQHS